MDVIDRCALLVPAEAFHGRRWLGGDTATPKLSLVGGGGVGVLLLAEVPNEVATLIEYPIVLATVVCVDATSRRPPPRTATGPEYYTYFCSILYIL